MKNKGFTLVEVLAVITILSFVLAIIVPLIYIVVASFMDPVELSNNGISFDFSKWSLEGYSRVFQDDMIIRGFINSMLGLFLGLVYKSSAIDV